MLQYLELRHVDFLEAEERGIAFEATREAARRFIDNFLSPKTFAAVGLLHSPRLLGWLLGSGRRDVVWITSLSEAKKKRNRFLHGLQRGFEAIFVLSATPEQVCEWFGGGYEPSDAGWSEITEHEEPVAYIDESALRRVVMNMVLQQGQCVCLVAHDHDPVYLIRNKTVAI